MSWGLSAAWLLIPTLTLTQLQQGLLMFAVISVLMGSDSVGSTGLLLARIHPKSGCVVCDAGTVAVGRDSDTAAAE